MSGEFNISTALEIMTGVMVPVGLFLWAQHNDKQHKEKAVAQAIHGDLASLQDYIASHLDRIAGWKESKSDVSARALGFLRLQSGLDTSDVVREASVLKPPISHAITKFYQHLRQNELILDNVIQNWERRTLDELAYQENNLKLLMDHVDDTRNRIKRAYPTSLPMGVTKNRVAN